MRTRHCSARAWRWRRAPCMQRLQGSTGAPGHRGSPHDGPGCVCDRTAVKVWLPSSPGEMIAPHKVKKRPCASLSVDQACTD